MIGYTIEEEVRSMEYIHPIPTTLSPEKLLEAFYGCLESSDDGFLIVDPDGAIAYINKAYADYLNTDPQSVLGVPVESVIDTSKMREAAQNLYYETEHNVIHRASLKQYRDGERHVIVNRSNVSVGGKPVGAVGQVKFVRETLRLSSALNDIYDELAYYKDELIRLSAERYSFQNILGHSPKILAAKSTALRTLDNDFPVLIQGETGTGKEVFANAIHYAGKRKDKPLIHVNCAAIPSELLESELFGYDAGAFTGASRYGKKGKFELADGGTLFLDEIGDMPLAMQAKLLRVLQEGELEHIGGTRMIPVDVRIVAATNQDLQLAVKEKRFRKDLYYRLNVLPLYLPPLRERMEDLDDYIDAFLENLNQNNHTTVRIAPSARKKLYRYQWPGNIRELQNVIFRSYAMRKGNTITSVHLPLSVHTSADDLAGQTLTSLLNQTEKEILEEVLRRNRGNIKKSAEDLGIHRVTFYKKMEKLGLFRDGDGLRR